MPKTVDMDDILKGNPHIDPAELERHREFMRKLRENAGHGSRYRITSPFGARRVSVGSGDSEDRRTVRLKRSRNA